MTRAAPPFVLQTAQPNNNTIKKLPLRRMMERGSESSNNRDDEARKSDGSASVGNVSEGIAFEEGTLKLRASDLKRKGDFADLGASTGNGAPEGAPQKKSRTTMLNAGDETSKEDPPERLNFPGKLMDLLQRKDKPEGIYWLPEGTMFAMQTQQMEAVLVKHFQGAKFMSFTRTLNKW